MVVDLGFNAVVNAAGGLLFLLAGVAIIAIAPRAPRPRLIGWFCIAFGANYIAGNVYPYDAARPDPTGALPAFLGIAVALATGSLAALLARDLARSVSRRARILVVAAAAALAALDLGISLLVQGNEELVRALGAVPGDVVGQLYGASLFLAEVGLLALFAACVAHVRTLPPEASRERRAALLLGLAFGLYIVFYCASVALRPGPPTVPVAAVVSALSFASGLVAVACVVPLIGATPSEPHLARRAVLACVVAALAGTVLGALDIDVGAYGIVRVVGVVLLAVAVLRYDLLGVPLPRLVARRGALATGALASLVVVAQVAQNVASPQYSLLIGGVASGALVLALEKRRGAPAPHASVESAASLAYRAAVRAALDDGTMTPREEEHLAEVAHHLRLSPLDAVRLRREVERELAERK